jgi:hypothetical protein
LFADESERHPEFYAKFSSEVRTSRDVAALGPAAKLRFPKLESLGARAPAKER